MTKKSQDVPKIYRRSYRTLSSWILKRLPILWVLFFFLAPPAIQATHIVGGEIRYKCLPWDRYEITLTVRRDCFFGADDAQFDDPASIGIFDNFGNIQFHLGQLGQIRVPFMEDDTLNGVFISDCGFIGSQVCVHETVYRDTVHLPPSPGGYILAYERCCRNGTLNNILNPLETGATYFTRITDTALNECNNSPIFNQWPDLYICVNEELSFDHSAIDADGDSLVYSLCVPNSGATIDEPKPQPPNQPPYGNVEWHPNFGLDNLLGGVPLQIDSETGLLTGTPSNIGQFLVGVCVEEYRNGVLISTLKRDFEYNVRVCSDPPMADFEVDSINCNNVAVQFENTSTNADLFKWYFDFPNADTSFISNEVSPIFTYPDTGTYTVVLEAIRALDGCKDTLSKEIKIIESNILADFDVDIAACRKESLLIRLTDLSNDTTGIDEIVSWSWLVEVNGEFFEATGNPAEILIPEATTVTVSLNVETSSGCRATLTREEELSPVFPVTFEYELLECSSDSIRIRLTDTTTGFPDTVTNTEWDWTVTSSDFTTTLTGNPVELSLPGSGVYTISLSTLLSNDCDGFTQQEVEVNTDLGIDFSFFIDACDGESISILLVNTASGIPEGTEISNLTWTVTSDGFETTASGDSAVVLLPQQGFYDVTLDLELENGCNSTLTEEINASTDLYMADFEFRIDSCVGDEIFIELINTTSGLPEGTEITDLTWNISGNGFETTLMGDSAIVELPIQGLYDVIMELTLSNGCELTVDKEINASTDLYMVDFKFQIDSCVGEEIIIELINTTSGIPEGTNITDLTWTISSADFQTIASGDSAIVQLPAQGIYDVTLDLVLSNGCNASTTKQINASTNLFMADFEFVIDSCIGDAISIQLINTTAEIPEGTNVNWTVTGNGFEATLMGDSAIVVLPVQEIYNVVLDLTLGNGCDISVSKEINASTDLYMADFDFVIDSCIGEAISIILVNTTSGIPEGTDILNLTWNVSGNGFETTAIGDSALIQLPIIGEYTVTMDLSLSNGCNISITKDINASPESYDISIVSNVPGCGIEGLILDLVVDISNLPANTQPASWNWTISGPLSTYNAEGESVQILVDTSGIYLVTLEGDLANGCKVNITEEVIVEQTIFDIGFDFEVVECNENGIQVIFSADSTNIPDDLNVINWSWKISRGDFSFETEGDQFEISLDEAGTYEIELLAQLSNGCIEVIDVEIDILTNDLGIDFIYEILGCEGDQILVQFTAVEDNIVPEFLPAEWQWVIDGNSYSGQSITVPFSSTGTFLVSLQAILNNDCPLTLDKEIVLEDDLFDIDYDFEVTSCIDETIVVAFNGIDSLLPEGVSVLSWNWKLISGQDTITAEGMNPEILLPGEGIYTIMINTLLSNGCENILMEEVEIVSGFLADFVFELSDCEDGDIGLIFTDASADLNGGILPVSWNWEVAYQDVVEVFEGESIDVVVPEGTVIVTLTIELENGCTTTISKTLPIIINLMADFKHQINSCDESGINLTLEDDSSPNFLGLIPTEWIWNLSYCGQEQMLEGEVVTADLDTCSTILIDYTVVFNNGCVAMIQRAINLEFPVISFISDSLTSCDGEPIFLVQNPNSDWDYTWTPEEGLIFEDPDDRSNPQAAPDTTTTYSVVVSSDDCQISGMVTVEVEQSPQVQILGNNFSCGDTVELTASGGPLGSNYEWSLSDDFENIFSTEEVIEVLVQGDSTTVYLRISDNLVCNNNIDSITIKDESINVSDFGPPVICLGDTVEVGIVPIPDHHMLNVVWEADPRILSDLNSNIILVTAVEGDTAIQFNYSVQNQFDCVDSGALTLEIGTPTDPDDISGSIAECGIFEFCFTSSGVDGQINWDFGDETTDADTSNLANPCYTYPSSGNYTVTVSSATGVCDFEEFSFEIFVPEPFMVNVESESLNYCPGNEVTLTATTNTEPATIIWLDENNMLLAGGDTLRLTPEMDMVITVIAADTTGCTDTTMVNLTEYLFNLSVTPPDILCEGEEAQIMVIDSTNSNLLYSWSPEDCIVSGGDTNAPIVASQTDKDLIATVTEPLTNCTTELIVPIDVSEIDILINVIPGEEINLGESVDLELISTGDSLIYEWNTGDTTHVLTVEPQETTTYIVTATDINGCTGVDQVTITVRQPVCNEEDIFLPTAFSPNNDGNNDVLFVRSNFIDEMELYIYDRWGEEVFRSMDQAIGWNGRYQNTGEELAPDVYAYALKVICVNEFEYIASGNVSLLR